MDKNSRICGSSEEFDGDFVAKARKILLRRGLLFTRQEATPFNERTESVFDMHSEIVVGRNSFVILGGSSLWKITLKAFYALIIINAVRVPFE